MITASSPFSRRKLDRVADSSLMVAMSDSTNGTSVPDEDVSVRRTIRPAASGV